MAGKTHFSLLASQEGVSARDRRAVSSSAHYYLPGLLKVIEIWRFLVLGFLLFVQYCTTHINDELYFVSRTSKICCLRSNFGGEPERRWEQGPGQGRC